MSQSHRVDLKNIDHIRLTCEHATIDGLTLDMDVGKPGKTEEEVAGGTSNRTTSADIRRGSFEKKPEFQPLNASEHSEDGKFHLLLASSGSVATIKLPDILMGLGKYSDLSIRIVLTSSAAEFLQGQSDEQPTIETLLKYPNVDAIYRDADEWRKPWVRNDPILHIELRRWADLMVIAPLSANMLAKVTNGICDNLLSCVVRAWEVKIDNRGQVNGFSEGQDKPQKRILMAPAMNTSMWRHPLTGSQIKMLESPDPFHWIDILRPVEKTLACGDTGDGAMASWKDIVSAIEKYRDD